MLTRSKSGILTFALAASLAITGCSGDDPPADATGSPTPGATSSASPSPVPTPKETLEAKIQPLGGTPATEEEKQYYRLQTKAKDLVLARSYKDAIPLLEQALEQQPKDVENAFYLLLSHGSLEMVPSKGSAAYPYAQKVVEIAPKSNEAQKARAYLVGASLEVPKDFKYGKKTFFTHGNFYYEPEQAYKLAVDAPLHVNIDARIGKEGRATLWEAEISPEMVSGTLKLPKGTEVVLLSEIHYFYSLTSWRKPLPKQPKEFSDSIFEVNAFFVEVVSEDGNKGKKGWLVNQVDRHLGDDTQPDPFGVWLPDRLKLMRESEAKAKGLK